MVTSCANLSINLSDRQETAGSTTLDILQDRLEQLVWLVKQKGKD